MHKSASRGRVVTLTLTRVGPDQSIHRVEFHQLGHVIYELREPDHDQIAMAHRMAAVLTDHADP